MKVTVWHKTDDDTMFQPYEPGHRVEPVFEFECCPPVSMRMVATR